MSGVGVGGVDFGVGFGVGFGVVFGGFAVSDTVRSVDVGGRGRGSSRGTATINNDNNSSSSGGSSGGSSTKNNNNTTASSRYVMGG